MNGILNKALIYVKTAVAFLKKNRIVSIVISAIVVLSLVLSIYIGIVYGNGVNGDEGISLKDSLVLGGTFTVEDVKAHIDYNHSGFDKDDIIEVYSVDNNGTRKVSNQMLTYDSESGTFTVIGVGKLVITITDRNPIDDTLKIESELETRFSSLDTLALVKTAIPEIDSDGIVSAEELSAVERIIIKDRQSVDGSDIQMLSSLKRIDIEGNAEVVKIENLNLPSGVSVHVSPERYTAYMNSDLWQSYKESIFATTADKDKVSIVLHKNGGTLLEDSGIEIETESITAGERLNLEKYNGILKTGYGLVSWYTYEKIDGESVKVTVDENYIFNNSTKLYAEWIPNKYTVKFHLNNGSEDLSTVFSYDEEKPLIATAPEYKKHILLGWTIEDGSYNVDYDVKEAVKNLSAENGKVIDLYAVWVTETFKVSYYGWSSTQGIYSDTPISEHTYKYGDSILIKADTLPLDPSNKGDFVGWSLSKNVKVPDFSNGDETDMLFGNLENGGEIKIYATYSYDTYTIGFSPTLEDAPLSVVSNAQKLTNLILPTPEVRYGYKFTGWLDTESGIYYHNNKSYCDKMNSRGKTYIYAPGWTVNGGLTTDKSNINLVKTWEKNYFEIVFESVMADTIFDSCTVTADEPFTLSGRLFKCGYKHPVLCCEGIGGYNLRIDGADLLTREVVNEIYERLLEGGTTHDTFDSESARIVVRDTSWTPISYNVRYDLNGGSGESATQVATYDKHLTLHPTPTRTGYIFDGWRSASGKKYTADELTVNLSVNDTDTVIMTALWAPITYNIEYDLNGGSGESATQVATYDEHLTLHQMPTRTGYIFDGWSLSNGKKYTAGERVINLSASDGETLTMTALWTPIKYNIEYDLNGGSGESATQVATYDKRLILHTPTRTGYIFSGWQCSNGEKYFVYVENLTATNGDTFKMTATWTPILYYIDFGSSKELMHYDESITLPTFDERTGYILNAYWQCSNGNTYNHGQSVSNLTCENGATLTMTSKVTYTPITYYIDYDFDGGIGDSTTQSAVYDSTISLKTAPTKAGYTFKGWRDSNGNIYGGSANVKNLTAINGDRILLTAVYEIITYTLTLDPSNGVDSQFEINYTVESIDDLTLPSVKYPTYPDYNVFTGWYENAMTSLDKSSLKTNPRDAFLAAKWSLCDVYTTGFPQTYDSGRHIIDLSKITAAQCTINSTIYIKDTASVYLIGNPDTTYNGLSISVRASASGQNAVIGMQNFNMTGWIYQEDNSVSTNVSLKVSGESSITAFAATPAIYKISNLSIVGSGALTLTGANGGNATTYGSNGNDGYAAISGSVVTINISGSVTAIGGNGGNGYRGADSTQQGTTGEERAWIWQTAGDGGKGGTGQAGGSGGNGGEAVVGTVKMQGGSCTLIGGRGGSGALGGRGGRGGTGGANTAWFGSTGNGGQGGDGGRGGNAGRGGNHAYLAYTIADGTSFSLVNGSNGAIGYGGQGGEGGNPGSANPLCGTGGVKGATGNRGANGTVNN